MAQAPGSALTVCFFIKQSMDSAQDTIQGLNAAIQAMRQIRPALVKLFNATGVLPEVRAVFLGVEDSVIASLEAQIDSLKRQIANLRKQGKSAKCPGF